MKFLRMNVFGTAATVALILTLVGCNGVQAPSPTKEPPISPAVKVSGLMDLPNPNDLSLAQVTEGLKDYLNSGSGPVAPRITALYAHWNLKPVPNSALVLDTDLNGDGSEETIAIFRDTKSATGSIGTLFVISNKDGRYQVDRSVDGVLVPALYKVADLNQDGRPEIVWTSTSIGANTTISQIHLSSWTLGNLQTQRTPISMTNLDKVDVLGKDLMLTGGTKGGAGAGLAQRSQVISYSLENGGLKMLDKHFATSTYSYHRLQDGLTAEEVGNLKEAGAAYASTTEPNRQVLPADAVPEEWRGKLADAVRTFSQLRIALLQIENKTPEEFVRKVLGGSNGQYEGLTKSAIGAKDRQGVCTAAIQWAEANPDFIKALNSPPGYGNPQWKAIDLCGPLPSF